MATVSAYYCDGECDAADGSWDAFYFICMRVCGFRRFCIGYGATYQYFQELQI